MIEEFKWFQERLGERLYFTDLATWQPPTKTTINRDDNFGGTSLEFRWATEKFRCPHCTHQAEVKALIKFVCWEDEKLMPYTFIEACHGHNEVIEYHNFQTSTLPDAFVSFMNIFFRKKDEA